MKVLEIIFLILLIIILYPGIDYLKKASLKSNTKGKGEPPATFTGSDYYTPKPVWSDNKEESYIYGGVPVEGTGNCRIYTYEQPLVKNKITNTGTYNLLSNVSFVKPNLNTAFQDFVNGNSHLSGKLTDTDQSTECTDPDQLNVKYASRQCLTESESGTLNKCVTNDGKIIKKGETYRYTVNCGDKICQGEVSCISLNYAIDGENIKSTTKCMAIKQITLPNSLKETYNLDFYMILGILKFDDKSGIDYDKGYPVEFSFQDCNTTDARQKFKIFRYNSKGGTSASMDDNLQPDPVGSYAAITFRGINSYLDIDTEGNFVLKQIKTGKPSETVKWIFFPETKISDNNIPSAQRCTQFRSNVVPDSSLLSKAEGGIEPVVYTAARIFRPASRLTDLFRRYTVTGKPIQRTTGEKGYEMKDFAKYEKPAENADGEPEAPDPAAEAPALDDEGFITNLGDTDLLPELVAETTTTAEAAGVNIWNPVGWALLIYTIFSVIFSILPNPSYDNKQPFSSYIVPKNTRVTPTNFLGDVTDKGPGSFGTANITPLEEFCVPRELLNYPPYFLECQTDGKPININKFINYGACAAYAITARNAFTFGRSPAYGIFLWTQPDSMNPKIGELFQDGETVWEVKETLSEAVEYPKSYFIDSGLAAVSSFEVPNQGNISNYNYRISDTGLIHGLNFTDDTTKQLKSTERITGKYLNIPSTGPSGSGGVSATFNVDVSEVSVSPIETQSKVTNLQISNPGSGYNSSQIVTIPFTEIGGSASSDNISFGCSVKTEVFIFKAATEYTNAGVTYYLPPEVIPPTTTTYTQKNSGFQIIAAVEQNSSGSVSITTENSIIDPNKPDGGKYFLPLGILSGGSGYVENDTLYMLQYNLDGELVAPALTINASDPAGVTETGTCIKTNCIPITVTDISSPGYTPGAPAPGILASSETISEFNLEYNFMDNAKNFFSVSPQQIVYGGNPALGSDGIITELSRQIKGNLTSDATRNLFLINKDSNTGKINSGGSFSMLNLKSIQVEKLKYKKVNISDASTITYQNIDSSKVIVGKFIPYSYFSPAFRSDDDKKDLISSYFSVNKAARNWNLTFGTAWDTSKFLLKYDVNEIYYNENNTQLIPYGIENVYSNAAFIKSAPKF